MPVVKLSSEHIEQVKPLFYIKKFMGISTLGKSVTNKNPVNKLLYDIFCSNYLSDLDNFHAYGYVDEDEDEVKSLISFYESVEEPAWYYTLYRSSGDNELLRPVLDKVIEHNEANGRLKFYTLVNQRHSRLLRRFHWSKYNDERYGYFDEYLVPAKQKCYYTNAWELLFKRYLSSEDCVVRCNYLKQEYRTSLPQGGNL
jgi:hypothetical protein